jgi:hypothetical protein
LRPALGHTQKSLPSGRMPGTRSRSSANPRKSVSPISLLSYLRGSRAKSLYSVLGHWVIRPQPNRREQRRIRIMAVFLLRILVLSNALLLALPARWCCAIPRVAARDVPVPKASCCTSCTPERKKHDSHPKPGLPGPAKDCCCPLDSTRLSSTEAATFAPSLSGPAAIVHVLSGGWGGLDVAGMPSPLSSPPLQLLNCVWLC